jgi:SAM-dependent methyltransferase
MSTGSQTGDPQTDIGALPILPPLDARIPKWPLDKLQFRVCPLCHKTNHPLLKRPDQLQVSFCHECDLWYVSSLPPEEELRKLYDGYWFSFRPRDLSGSYAARVMSDKALLDDDIRLNRLSALSGGLDGKLLLEIGCGCGEFLASARGRGATVFGNDISPEACSFVSGLLGIPVFQGPLSSAAFTEKFGLMDIVVMSDLIEHPVDPLGTFEAALKVLKPGGLFLILTPNGGEASDNVERAREWIGFRVDLEHLQYLSSATILGLAGKYHCRIEHLETVGFPALEGIDQPPSGGHGSIIRAQLRKSRLARRAVRAARAFRERPDPRCGTYRLIAVLRNAKN